MGEGGERSPQLHPLINTADILQGAKKPPIRAAAFGADAPSWARTWELKA